MFKKFSFCALLFALCVSLNFAQTTTTGDYHKVEVFGGYSNNQVDVGVGGNNGGGLEEFFSDRESFNGVNIAATGNINRYVGIKGDFSAHFKNFTFRVPAVGTTPATDVDVDGSLYNFLGGVQVKDNSRGGSRLRPFGHALAGVAHGRTEIDDQFFTSAFCSQPGIDCRQDVIESDTGFAASLGGGLDVKATDRISVRAFQVDYNPTRLAGSTQHNFRFGIGVVFH
ncbi:MAG: outer membrane beta-barrel protein [Acidobacteriota bacterium]|nr:outer membrane beta-barrel protein [Acidobacteriota bacterium]